MAEGHRHPSPSPHPCPYSACPPPLYYLPLTPAVMDAANAVLTLLNLFLTRTNPPLERIEYTCCLLPLESILGRDSGTGGVGITPDAALTENWEDIVILLTIKNLEYR